MAGLGVAFLTGVVDAANRDIYDTRKAKHEQALRDRDLQDWQVKQSVSTTDARGNASYESKLGVDRQIAEETRKKAERRMFIDTNITDEDEKKYWYNAPLEMDTKVYHSIKSAGGVWNPKKKGYDQRDEIDRQERLGLLKSTADGMGWNGTPLYNVYYDLIMGGKTLTEAYEVFEPYKTTDSNGKPTWVPKSIPKGTTTPSKLDSWEFTAASKGVLLRLSQGLSGLGISVSPADPVTGAVHLIGQDDKQSTYSAMAVSRASQLVIQGMDPEGAADQAVNEMRQVLGPFAGYTAAGLAANEVNAKAAPYVAIFDAFKAMSDAALRAMYAENKDAMDADINAAVEFLPESEIRTLFRRLRGTSDGVNGVSGRTAPRVRANTGQAGDDFLTNLPGAVTDALTVRPAKRPFMPGVAQALRPPVQALSTNREPITINIPGLGQVPVPPEAIIEDEPKVNAALGTLLDLANPNGFQLRPIRPRN